jgi:hypothetical protein
MVRKPTGRDRGRPKKKEVTSILRHPRRRSVLALRATLKGMKQPSIRAAAKVVASMVIGNEVEHEGLPLEASEVISACPPGMTTLVYGPSRRIGTGAIKGAAEDIRQLDRQAQKEAAVNPDVARWLRCGVNGLLMLQDPFAPKDLIAAVFRDSGDPDLAAFGQKLVTNKADDAQ